MPIAEIAAAVSLILAPMRTLGLAFALALLLGIGAVAIAAWVRGATGECGCMGALSSEPLSFRTVLRLVGLVLIAALAIMSRMRWLKFDDLEFQASTSTAILVTLGLATLVLMTVTAVKTFRRFTRRWGRLWTY